MPLNRWLKPIIAWYGDMDLASHLWLVAGMGKTTISVQFHEPVTFDQFGGRKELANYCWAVISGGVSDAISGRLTLKKKRRWWPTKRLFNEEKRSAEMSRLA